MSEWSDHTVVRCADCSSCAVVTPCGFASTPYMRCTDTGRDVGPSDGCTFGVPGPTQTGIEQWDAYLAGHPSDPMLPDTTD